MLLWLAVLSGILVTGARSCSCQPRSLQTSLCTAERLVKVRVYEEIDQGIDFDLWENQMYSRRYKATVLKVFHGDGTLEEDRSIVIETAANEAMCGIRLSSNSVMLLELDYYFNEYQISLCKIARNWDYELDDNIMAQLSTGTIDCECQPKSRRGTSPCCQDFMNNWSVRYCTDQFGSCRKHKQASDSQCGWDTYSQYSTCLAEFGFMVNNERCVQRKPCPKHAVFEASLYEQPTCDSTRVKKLSWHKKMCVCPKDMPFIDQDADSCVSGHMCPRGEAINHEDQPGSEAAPTTPPIRMDNLAIEGPGAMKEGDIMEDDDMVNEGDDVIEGPMVEYHEEEGEVRCPNNQIFYGNGKCLPCLQNCGSPIAWCTRICITNECGCPAGKPVLAIDTCYTQDECEFVNDDDCVEDKPIVEETCNEVEVTCLADSCINQGCKGFPEARCKSNNCGSCQANFYDKKGNKIEKCQGELLYEVTDAFTTKQTPFPTTPKCEGADCFQPASTVSSDQPAPDYSTSGGCIGVACYQTDPTDTSSGATTQIIVENETGSSSEPASTEPATPSTPVCIGLSCVKVTDPDSSDSSSPGIVSDETPTPTSASGETSSEYGEFESTETGITKKPSDTTTAGCIGTACFNTESTATAGIDEDASATPTSASEETSSEYGEFASTETGITKKPSDATTAGCIGIACFETPTPTSASEETSSEDGEFLSTETGITAEPSEPTTSGCIGIACFETEVATVTTPAPTLVYEIDEKTSPATTPGLPTDAPTTPIIGSSDEQSTEMVTVEGGSTTMMASPSNTEMLECSEEAFEVENECPVSDCVKTCNEECRDDVMIVHDDNFIRIQFGGDCAPRCDCRSGYVRDEFTGVCISEQDCSGEAEELESSPPTTAISEATTDPGQATTSEGGCIGLACFETPSGEAESSPPTTEISEDKDEASSASTDGASGAQTGEGSTTRPIEEDATSPATTDSGMSTSDVTTKESYLTSPATTVADEGSTSVPTDEASSAPIEEGSTTEPIEKDDTSPATTDSGMSTSDVTTKESYITSPATTVADEGSTNVPTDQASSAPTEEGSTTEPIGKDDTSPATTDSMSTSDVTTEETYLTSPATTGVNEGSAIASTDEGSTSVPVDEAQSPSTEEATSPSTKEATSPSTEEATSPSTEEATSPSAEEGSSAPSEEATSPSTEEATSPSTEEATSPSTEEASSPSTEEATSPSTEEASSPSTEEATSPSTEEAISPFTEEATSPSTDEATSPSVEEGSSAPTEEATSPSTEEAASPSTEEDTSPSTEEASSPSTEEATSPSTEEASSPSTEEATSPSTEEATSPSTEEATSPSTEEATSPSVEEGSSVPTEEATSPSTEEATSPSTEEATSPSTEEATSPSTEEATSPSTEEATSPSTEEATSPSTEEVSSAATEEATSPSTEEATSPSTEEATSPSTEEATSPSTDEASSPSTEEATSPSTEEATSPSTEEGSSAPTDGGSAQYSSPVDSSVKSEATTSSGEGSTFMTDAVPTKKITDVPCSDDRVNQICLREAAYCGLAEMPTKLICNSGCGCPDDRSFLTLDFPFLHPSFEPSPSFQEECVAEADCPEVPVWSDVISKTMVESGLNLTTLQFDPDCSDNNPSCAAWAKRDYCTNAYVIKHCKLSCGLCPATEVPKTCEEVRDELESLNMPGSPASMIRVPICKVDSPEMYFPRQQLGNVFYCVDENGITDMEHAHHVSHIDYQCPGFPECPQGLSYLSSGVKMTCEQITLEVDPVPTEGCGCPSDKPIYVEDGGYCRSVKGACETDDCYGGTEFHECGSACPDTCENFFQMNRMCSMECVIGCQCPSNKVDNGNGECVFAHTCQDFEMKFISASCSDRKEFMLMYDYGSSIDLPLYECDTQGNFAWEQSDMSGGYVCVDPETGVIFEDTEHMKSDDYDCEVEVKSLECSGGMRWGSCQSSCPDTCDNMLDSMRPACTMECVQTCACPPNLVENADGDCVRPHECDDFTSRWGMVDCNTREDLRIILEYEDTSSAAPACVTDEEGNLSWEQSDLSGGYICVDPQSGVIFENTEHMKSDDYDCEVEVKSLECSGGKRWGSCQSSCPDTCDNMLDSMRPACSMECVQTCACPPNLVENADGDCVRPHECDDFTSSFRMSECDLREQMRTTFGYEDTSSFAPPANCTKNGDFEFEQCDQLSGRCFCVDIVTGEEIETEHDGFGEFDCEVLIRTELCDGDMIWTRCGSSCDATCEDPVPKCTRECAERCECPSDKPIFDDDRQMCMPVMECPTKSPPMPTCEGGKEYNMCGTACPGRCDNMFDFMKPCTMQCVQECQCPLGMVENVRGECVKPTECDGFDMMFFEASCVERRELIANYQLVSHMDMPMLACTSEGNYEWETCFDVVGFTCFCVDPELGRLVADTEHERSEANPDYCEIELRSRECLGNKRWSNCASSCEATCLEPVPPCNKMCNQKCTCPEDYPIFDEETNMCMSVSECPTMPAPQESSPATTAQMFESSTITSDGSGIQTSTVSEEPQDKSSVETTQPAVATTTEPMTTTQPALQCDEERNFVFNRCGSACVQTCDEDCSDLRNFGEECTYGCSCEDGFVLHLGNCIMRDQCPIEWQSVTVDTMYELDLEATPLEVQTNSAIGSQDNFRVQFFAPNGIAKSGELRMRFDAPTPKYHIPGCTITWTSFVMPAGEEYSWRIEEVTKALIVYCNDEEVINYVFKSSPKASCNNMFKRNTAQFKFIVPDVASTHWRIRGSGQALVEFEASCEPGNYYHSEINVCQHCPRSTWSNGGDLRKCTACPEGTEVMKGQGVSEESCIEVAQVGGFRMVEVEGDEPSFECVNANGEVIKDSRRSESFGMSPTEYCDYRFQLAQASPCYQIRSICEEIGILDTACPGMTLGDFYSPVCRTDGLYEPEQCSYKGQCFCVDEYGSSDIDNQLSYSSRSSDQSDCVALLEARANAKQCIQDRREHDAQIRDMMVGGYQPNCTSSGDYNPTQCRGAICYCVDARGRVMEDSEHDVGFHDDSLCGMKRERAASRHCAVNQAGPVACNADGFYMARQANMEGFYCAEPELGLAIPNTIHDVMDSVNCDAEVTILMSSECNMERKKAHKESEDGAMGVFIASCDISGYFHHTQHFGSTLYCADKYGQELSGSRGDVMPDKEVECIARRTQLETSGCYMERESWKAGNLDWEPFCDDYGRYQPRQCYPTNCVCVNEDGGRLMEAENGIRGVEFCENLRRIHVDSACYHQETGGMHLVCNVLDGLFEPSQCSDDVCNCHDVNTGNKLEGTAHPESEKGRCGTTDSPYVRCSDRPAQFDSSSFQCTSDGMFFRQQCIGNECSCMDRWGAQNELKEHHVGHGLNWCFSEEAGELATAEEDTPYCQVLAMLVDQVASDVEVFTAQCAAAGNFLLRQCYRDTCFCVDKSGYVVDNSDHAPADMEECADVMLHIRGPTPMYVEVGGGSSITCSVSASYSDETFVMMVDGERYDSESLPDSWKSANFERTETDFENGTISTAIEGFMDTFSTEHNNTVFQCISDKNNVEGGLTIQLAPVAESSGYTTETMVVTDTASQTPTTPTPTPGIVEQGKDFFYIYNPRRGYVIVNSEEDVNVAMIDIVNVVDERAMFEYMDDNTLRSIAYPDMYLTQNLQGGTIIITLKEFKGNTMQTWYQDEDAEGEKRLFVWRQGKKGRTEYYLDYFKKELTGYKATNKPNQQWDLVLVPKM